MGRIVTTGAGAIHVGGRRRPAVPHGLMLTAPKFGLDLSAWPATPTSTAYAQLPGVQPVLSDVLLNDKLGCCTQADKYKRQAIMQAMGGRPVYHPPGDVIVADYARDGGYTGDPSTDHGCDEVVVLSNARDIGVRADATGAVDRIAAYMVLDPHNRDLVRACSSMFGPLSICAELDDRLLSAVSAGATWTVPPGGYKPNPDSGHCWTFVDQQENAALWSTWGVPIFGTYDLLAAAASPENGGALYVVVDAQILSLAQQAAPDGLDWAALLADFNALPSGVIEPPGP